MKKAMKIIAVIVAVLLSIPLLALLFLQGISSGKAQPILDAAGKEIPGSISVIERWKIGGAEQSVIIRGKNKSNPVLLFLHGGPGSPEFAFYRAINTSIEDHVTVVHWEQRGAGMSYEAGLPDGPDKIGRFVDDTIEISEKLAKRFGQKKIYLLGHSWGSMLGALTVKKRPDLYHAFIAVGVAANLAESEKVAWEWALARARENKNEEAVRELTAIGPGPYPIKNFDRKGIEIKWVMHYGGGMVHDTRDLYWKMLEPLIFLKEYTLPDKVNFIRGNMKTLEGMWDEIIAVNLFEKAEEYRIPVYFLQGEYDYQVATPVVKKYFAHLKAPVKKYYSFENSAHGIIFEEPKKFHDILVSDILKTR